MRTALVTGASRGIGRGIALELAGQGYGLTVTSRSTEDLRLFSEALREAGASNVVHRAADLADRAAVASLADLHRQTYAGMDALVLSGGVGTAGPIDSLPQGRVDKTLVVNFTSALAIVRGVLPLLRTSAEANPGFGARVIMLSSITGVFAEPGLAIYGAAKVALMSLAETLNAEESGRGVMATAIAPGFVDTDMAAWTTDSIPAATMIPVEDVVAAVRMLLGLNKNTSITKLVLSRSGTSGYGA